MAEPVAVPPSLAVDLELNLPGLRVLLRTVPSGAPHYRSLEVVSMEVVAMEVVSLEVVSMEVVSMEVVTMEVVAMEVVAMEALVTLALQVVADTPGCELGLSGAGGQLGLHLEIEFLGRSQLRGLLPLRSLRAFLGCPGVVFLKPSDNDLLLWSLCRYPSGTFTWNMNSDISSVSLVQSQIGRQSFIQIFSL